MKNENYIMIRDKEVVKANDLIQKSRFSLSLLQQKIILYIISQIEYNDTEFKEYEFDIRTFCKVCGIDFDNGGNYVYLKEQIKQIRDKSLWIKLPDGRETLLAWIEKASIVWKETEDKRYLPTGTLKIRLDNDLRPYLIALKSNYSRYELIYTLHFKGKRTIRMYELIKSIHYHDLEPYERVYEIDDLKRLLDAETYKTYQHFKDKVLDLALREINEYSDKQLSYEPIKEGRKITKIKLHIETKSIEERLKIRAIIDREMNYNPDQISIWEIEENG